MSTLEFDGTRHTLTLFDRNHSRVGEWPANNVVDSHATLRFVPNRDYRPLDTTRPHTHGTSADSANGSYGSYGIVRLEEFDADGTHHSGVGIHSGRASQGGPDHATYGCIRTTDEAMGVITRTIANDALTNVTVTNNHPQGATRSVHKGDHHPQRKKSTHKKPHKPAGSHPAQPRVRPDFPMV